MLKTTGIFCSSQNSFTLIALWIEQLSMKVEIFQPQFCLLSLERNSIMSSFLKYSFYNYENIYPLCELMAARKNICYWWYGIWVISIFSRILPHALFWKSCALKMLSSIWKISTPLNQVLLSQAASYSSILKLVIGYISFHFCSFLLFFLF